MNHPELEKWIVHIVGKEPASMGLYVRAVTHGSHGDKDYQRLEFLGDRVLGLVIAEKLYHQFANEPEGRLSQRLNQLVSGATCSEIAKEIGAENHLLLGKQARDDGARGSAKVLGDVMESLIGAIFLDHGVNVASDFILKYWNGRILGMTEDVRHPKSALQEWAASNNRKIPEYRLINKNGPDHDLKFTVSVSVSKIGEIEATAQSIQAAETTAAKAFLDKYT